MAGADGPHPTLGVLCVIGKSLRSPVSLKPEIHVAQRLACSAHASHPPVSARFSEEGLACVRGGITLVEMLIAMAITLLMMAAVVTLFANISSSVSKRRATIEMSTQMQQVRAMLQRDLAGATCPAVPWQRPESNHGYIELIEGPQSDANPSQWIFDSDGDGVGDGLGPALRAATC